MVVPTNRNRNHYHTPVVARPTKSKYRLELDHSVSYAHVARRTKKGGVGGGYVYSSGAYGANGNGDGDGGGVVFAIIMGLIFAVCAIIYVCCRKAENSRSENHSDIRTTRNSVWRQRSERGRSNNVPNNDNTTANAIQFHTSPNVYNSPSGGDPTLCVTALPERNVNMKPYFYFQTVLPDKSNLDTRVLREEAEIGDTSSDEDSVIEHGDPPTGKKGAKKKNNKGAPPPSNQLSSRFLMSTWRRPTANDECTICLLTYEPGQTICLAKNTKCNHVFHHDCIEEWLKDHSDCPLCRVNIMYKPP